MFRRSASVAAALALCFLVCAPLSASAQTNVWRTLGDGDGLVILYRHALAPGGGDPAGFDVDDCSTQRNLSDDGRQQARNMGRQLRARGVDVSRVLSSPWCRSRETADLMDVGRVRELKRLGSVFTAPTSVAQRREAATRRLIERHADRSGVMILVGHQANIIDVTGVAPTSGEGVVVRHDEGEPGGLEVLGIVPAPEIRGGP